MLVVFLDQINVFIQIHSQSKVVVADSQRLQIVSAVVKLILNRDSTLLDNMLLACFLVCLPALLFSVLGVSGDCLGIDTRLCLAGNVVVWTRRVVPC